MSAVPADQVAADFRLAMRRLAGGVTVVTASDGVRRYGMTMTAVMSLAMEPPSLVLAVNRNASIIQALTVGREFGVNLLHHSHEGFCQRFSALPSDERFTIGDWEYTPEGTPYLSGAGAAIFCRVGPMYDFGTHRLVIGTVEHSVLRDEIDPLIHLDGRYRQTR